MDNSKRPYTSTKGLKCLECGEPVYARYLCKKHYNALNKKQHSVRRQSDREERKRATLARTQRELRVNGVYCGVSFCSTKTLSETGLCGVHELRSKLWQFTPQELVSIYETGCCESCGNTESLVLDHTHGLSCEEVHRGANGCPSCFRGLLCTGCNTGLGMLRDDPSRIRGLLRYLESRV